MHERRINARAVIYDDNKLFAVTHRTKDGGETDYWATPGGGIDAGEFIETGLQRELQEELGVAAKIGRLLFVQQFQHERWDGRPQEKYEFFFHIENPEAFRDTDLAATSHGTHELVRAEFIDPKSSHLLPHFLQKVDIQAHIDGTRPVYIANRL